MMDLFSNLPLPRLELDALSSARAYLAERLKFLRVALYSLRPVRRPGLGTLSVDRYWRLYYDPDYLTTLSREELAGVLYHELDHLRRHHFERLASVTKNLANVAGDLAINDDIRDHLGAHGIRLPSGVLYPEQFGFELGLLEESYVSLLRSRESQSGSGGQQSSSSSSSSSSGSGSGSSGSQPDPADQQSHGAGIPYNGSERPHPGAGRCGSAATGQSEPWELPPDDPRCPGVTDSRGRVIWRRVAQEAIEQEKKNRGSVPADILRWAEQQLAPPRVDWRRELSSVISSEIAAAAAGMCDYSYSRLNRRQWTLGGDVQLPGWVGPQPVVAIVADTSGSMSDDEIGRVASEAMGIVRSIAHGRAYLIACDADVHVAREVRSASDITSSLVGGGGTDMGVGMAEAVRRFRPDVLVIITDGITPWPVEKPEVKRIVVCLIHPGHATPPVPGWAKVVRIER